MATDGTGTIHAPLVLPYTAADMKAVLADARYVLRRYESGKAESVYRTSQARIQMGLLAEHLLARHRGVQRADVRKPHRTPYDVAPDIEVRTVRRPGAASTTGKLGTFSRWADVALVLYAKDAGKLQRRWVLAMEDSERMDVRYLGWQTGKALRQGSGQALSREGKPYRVLGMLWPDQLLAMADLL